jgi:hypothetical protein
LVQQDRNWQDRKVWEFRALGPSDRDMVERSPEVETAVRNLIRTPLSSQKSAG